jgi:hypothetical protein
MKKKLTDRFLQTVKPPSAGRLVVADTEVRGLTFRMTPLGFRSFMVRYRPRGKAQRTYTVGSYPTITLVEARLRARNIVAAAKQGVDLVAEERRREGELRKAAATARTVRELVGEYIDHSKHHLRRWRQVEIKLGKHVVPVLGDRPANSIRRADVVELLDGMQAKGLRQQVNRVRTALSTMFGFALEREYVDVNPVAGTKPRKLETERARILTDDELRAIWQALSDMPNPGRSFVQALMLTGARHAEVREMPWSEIADGIWTLPAARNKAKRDFEIPLSTPMVRLLAEIPRVGDDFVFTATGARPWTKAHSFKADLDRRSRVTGWVYHDIRRTVRSRLAELQVPFEIAERVLNHAMTKLERTYNRHAYREEKRAALQLWADRLAVIVGQGREAPNVVEFKPPSA